MLDRYDKIDFFCIGTPKIHGDAIGPLVGSMLTQHLIYKDVNIVGTLDAPVTTTSYKKHLYRLRDDALIVVVDATVGHPSRLGSYDIVEEPTNPGGALATGIAPVGDISVKAYTGSSVEEILRADIWDVTLLAHRITTELLDLLSFNKNKEIYRI